MKAIRKRVFGLTIEAHPVVFPAAAVLVVLFVLGAALAPARANILFGWLQQEITTHFSWLYILSMTGFLCFALFLGFSRYGKLRLGSDVDRPEFGTATWFAMLFSAGMGIGMLFYGVVEPVSHYLSPPRGEAASLLAARESMGITLFHWGFHPWALYALVALALAYFGFRRGLPLSFRSVFYPILGSRIHGRLGDCIDILAVLATLFGLATSLGLGAKQVNAGLYYVFGLEQGTGIQVTIIACITAVAVASLVSGLDVGIRRLSELNMGLAGFLLLFLFVFGPTVFLFNSLVENVGEYLRYLPKASFWTASYQEGSASGWLGGWTVFYWGWWIAWSPFVGMFIARISKGRTIREFIAGTLLVPTGVAAIWMTGFGSTALHQEIYDDIAPTQAAREAIEARYNYEPRTLPVAVLDGASGLPVTDDGQWLVGPTAKSLASPKRVRLQPVLTDADAVDGGLPESIYQTPSGAQVRYAKGVLVDADQPAQFFPVPFRPAEEDLYSGPYASTDAPMSLGAYKGGFVLSEDHTTRVDTTATAMFFMLEAYPIAAITSLIATLSVVLFFVTSSDSASLVADIIASGGSENPTTGTRIFWGLLEGTLASVLLVAGGLKALQTGSITIGLPFCIIVIGMCVSLWIGLRREMRGDLPEAHKRAIAGETKPEKKPAPEPAAANRTL